MKTIKEAFERDSKLATANNLQALQIQELRKILDKRPLQKAAPTAGLPGAPMGYRDDEESAAQLTVAHDEEEAVKQAKEAIFAVAESHFAEGAPNALKNFKQDIEILFSPPSNVEKYLPATECDIVKITKSFGVSYERDTGRFELQKAADGYYISGYISDGSLDRDNDRMSQNALKMMENAMKGGMALFADHEHGAFDTLGHFTEARLDGKGLWAEAKLENPETNANVKSLISKLESGIPLGFSIGGDMAGSKMVKETGEDGKPRTIREIQGVKLYEVSVVGLPSNPNARITNLR